MHFTEGICHLVSRIPESHGEGTLGCNLSFLFVPQVSHLSIPSIRRHQVCKPFLTHPPLALVEYPSPHANPGGLESYLTATSGDRSLLVNLVWQCIALPQRNCFHPPPMHLECMSECPGSRGLKLPTKSLFFPLRPFRCTALLSDAPSLTL